MEDTIQKLREMYIVATAREPERRVINAWARAIESKSKTTKDFAESLTTQPEYRGVVESLYRMRLSQLVPDGVPNGNEVSEMLSRCVPGQVLTEHDVDEYIKGLPAYRTHQEELVMRVVNIVAPDIDDSVVRMFVDRMAGASGDEYTLEHVHADLEAMVNDSTNNNGNNNSNNNGNNNSKNNVVQSRDETTSPITLPSVEMAKASAAPFGGIHELSAKLEVFEEAFGRKMYVEEFVLYGAAFLDGSLETMKRASAVFDKSYNRVREIYTDYADVMEFTQYEFIKRHLYEYDRPNFFDDLARDLLNSDTYQDGMRRKLQALHMEFYDEELDASSLSYVFERVRQSAIGLHDEQLIHMIKELKKETDLILENVFYVYMAVYARSPEYEEQKQHIEEYRVHLSESESSSLLSSSVTDIANARLMERLIQTLEFHDVVKTKIRIAWGSYTSSSTPSAGALYQVLKKVLDVLGTCKTLASVDNVVEEMVRHAVVAAH